MRHSVWSVTWVVLVVAELVKEPPDWLRRPGSSVVRESVLLRLLDEVEAAERFLTTQPDVGEVVVDGDRVRFTFAGGDEEMAALLARAIGAGLRITEFGRIEADLEDIFLQTTKGNLQ